MPENLLEENSAVRPTRRVGLERTQLQHLSTWAFRIGALALLALFSWPLINGVLQHPLSQPDQAWQSPMDAAAKKRIKAVAKAVKEGRKPTPCESGIKP